MILVSIENMKQRVCRKSIGNPWHFVKDDTVACQIENKWASLNFLSIKY